MTPKRMNQLLYVILLLIVVGIFGGLYYANHEVTDIAAQTVRNKADIEITKAQIDAYRLTQIKVDSLSYVDSLAETVLPQSKDESAVVAELSQFAARARLGVSEITFDQQETNQTGAAKEKVAMPAGVDVVPITISLKPSAQFENLLEFLRSIENNRRTMQVTNISLKPDETNRSVLSSITIAINLYTKKVGN